MKLNSHHEPCNSNVGTHAINSAHDTDGKISVGSLYNFFQLNLGRIVLIVTMKLSKVGILKDNPFTFFIVNGDSIMDDDEDTSGDPFLSNTVNADNANSKIPRFIKGSNFSTRVNDDCGDKSS